MKSYEGEVKSQTAKILKTFYNSWKFTTVSTNICQFNPFTTMPVGYVRHKPVSVCISLGRKRVNGSLTCVFYM